MTEEARIEGESDVIKPTDIVFDCPHCGKSLAIDYRGAGMTIPCSDCGRKVEVPIPEGMELTDLDSDGEELEAQILSLRRAHAAAELHIEELEDELEEVTARRDALERYRIANMSRLARVAERVGLLRDSLETALGAVRDILDSASGETNPSDETPASPDNAAASGPAA